MTKDESRRILKSVIPANSARLDGDLYDPQTGGNGTIFWVIHRVTADVNGSFDADQLEAIAVYMRDNYEPTRE